MISQSVSLENGSDELKNRFICSTKGRPHYNHYIKKEDSHIPFCSEVPAVYRFLRDDSIDPETTPSDCNNLASFGCNRCGYEWTRSIAEQANSKGKCECCSLGWVVRKGVNDIFTLLPEALAFFDFEKFKGDSIYSTPLRDTNILFPWKCPLCNREWSSTLYSRVNRVNGKYSFIGCFFCEKTTLVLSVPKLRNFWDYESNNGKDIRYILATSPDPAFFRCPNCGYKWTQEIVAFYHSKYACPCCDPRKKRQNFGFVHPDLMEEYDPANTVHAYAVSCHSKVVVSWICRLCGESWTASFYQRHRGMGKCPCSCNKAIPGVNTLLAKFPDIVESRVSEDNTLDPDSVLPASSEIIRVNCPYCLRSYSAKVRDVVEDIDECPRCSRKNRLAAFSFINSNPDVAGELYFASFLLSPSPDEVTSAYNGKFWFVCRNVPEHIYPMSPASRLLFKKREREPCVYCRGLRVKMFHFVEPPDFK